VTCVQLLSLNRVINGASDRSYDRQHKSKRDQRVANTASKILLLTISHKKHKAMNDTRKLTGYDIRQPDSVVS